MHNLMKFLGGIGVLITIYLFLANGKETVRIINAIAYNSIDGVQVLSFLPVHRKL